MKKIKKLTLCIMTVAAMATSMAGISTSAVQEECMNSVEPESSSSNGDYVNWTDEYVNGELVSTTGVALSPLFPLSNLPKDLNIMSTYYYHITTTDSDHRLILEQIINTSGETRYAAGTTYICDTNFSIDWSHYNGNTGYILHSPVTVSTGYVKSGLSNGLHFATCSSCVYAANTPNAPIENNAIFYNPIS